eukprot:GCRY01004784.1.p1 GENE.GCRY01004784.1~~GCRY01004784.1.p1  ORF type:complete len:325 (+),score=86.10 GCRY01004784.1:230-1204(+)
MDVVDYELNACGYFGELNRKMDVIFEQQRQVIHKCEDQERKIIEERERALRSKNATDSMESMEMRLDKIMRYVGLHSSVCDYHYTPYIPSSPALPTFQPPLPHLNHAESRHVRRYHEKFPQIEAGFSPSQEKEEVEPEEEEDFQSLSSSHSKEWEAEVSSHSENELLSSNNSNGMVMEGEVSDADDDVDDFAPSPRESEENGSVARLSTPPSPTESPSVSLGSVPSLPSSESGSGSEHPTLSAENEFSNHSRRKREIRPSMDNEEQWDDFEEEEAKFEQNRSGEEGEEEEVMYRSLSDSDPIVAYAYEAGFSEEGDYYSNQDSR